MAVVQRSFVLLKIKMGLNYHQVVFLDGYLSLYSEVVWLYEYLSIIIGTKFVMVYFCIYYKLLNLLNGRKYLLSFMKLYKLYLTLSFNCTLYPDSSCYSISIDFTIRGSKRRENLTTKLHFLGTKPLRRARHGLPRYSRSLKKINK